MITIQQSSFSPLYTLVFGHGRNGAAACRAGSAREGIRCSTLRHLIGLLNAHRDETHLR